MNRLALLALLCIGCGSATAVEAPAGAQTRVVPMDTHELARVDIRGTAASMQMGLEHIQSMRSAPARDTREAAHHLVVTCPYNRAAVQLPRALHMEVSRIDADRLDPLIQQDWRYLQEALSAHVAALDALGAALPMPGSDAYLADKLPPLAALTIADLEESPQPVGATRPLLEAIRPIVDGYDEAIGERLQVDRDALMAVSGRGQLYTDELAGYYNAMRRIQPFVTEPALSAQVGVMVDMLELFAMNSC